MFTGLDKLNAFAGIEQKIKDSFNKSKDSSNKSE
jgi:hypothetical protein